MPELPEVETTRRGIARHLQGKRIAAAVVRERRLRVPVTPGIAGKISGQQIETIGRRGKYLLLYLQHGCIIWHLGMSGSLRIVRASHPPAAHDHIDIVFGRKALRFCDPRRFGTVVWCSGDPLRHRLLADLGPEPLGGDFNADYLYRVAHGRRTAVKNLIMNARIVAGVGNIYANEALFTAGIRPQHLAGRISKERCRRLVAAIRTVLEDAIRCGGTSLRDFVREDGKPGYFEQHLAVYHRGGEPCPACATPIKQRIIGQRTSFYCPACQL